MNIAVYCSAKDSIPEDYKCLGDALGTWIAAHGHNLVYGGATGGLMTRVSEAFRKEAQRVEAENPTEPRPRLIGIVPQRIFDSDRRAEHCDELVVVTDMAERKRTMRERADLFVCMPGSYGTLDEMFDAIASATVCEHHKPILVLNYQGFYEGLKQLIAHMHTLEFLPKDERDKLHFRQSVEEVEASIEYWTQKQQNRLKLTNN